MDTKIVKATLNLKIPAQQATAKAPLGPSLGQYGIPIADFCNKFNLQTSIYEEGVVLKCFVTLFTNMDYEFKIMSPDLSFIIKQAISISCGSKIHKKISITSDNEYLYIINSFILYETCKLKYEFMESMNSMDSIDSRVINFKSFYLKVRGTLKSMGIIII